MNNVRNTYKWSLIFKDLYGVFFRNTHNWQRVQYLVETDSILAAAAARIQFGKTGDRERAAIENTAAVDEGKRF